MNDQKVWFLSSMMDSVASMNEGATVFISEELAEQRERMRRQREALKQHGEAGNCS